MKLEKMNYGKEKVHKIFLYGLISVVVLLLTITLITSRANYKISSSVQLAKGKINYKAPDLNVIAMYVNNGDGNYQELSTEATMPTEGYTINNEKSYCYKATSNEHDNNVEFNTDILGQHIIENLSRNDKCYLYFDKTTYTSKTMSEILKNNYVINTSRTIDNKSFNVPFETTTYGTVYEAEDDYGTSYYFAGAPLDNWVKFGKQDGKDIWWRIIRINGNGSIRMIYTGTTAPTSSQASVMTGTQTQIGTSAFNTKIDDNMYSGFYYTINQVHGYGTPSNVYNNSTGDVNRTSLKEFYEKNIKDQSYETWIDKNVGFCNDRVSYLNSNPDSSISGGGTGTTLTYFAAHLRLRPNIETVTLSTTTVKPTLKCSYQGTEANSYKDSDLFTASGSTDIGSIKGNKVLPYSIGLITADEVSYAGMIFNAALATANNYLYTGRAYWAMSPSVSTGGTFAVYSSGYLTSNSVSLIWGIRPVINIKADTPLIGTGTYNDP